MHSTNYFDTFILVSPDSVAKAGKTALREGGVAARQYAMIMAAPYSVTSDDVIFGVFADRNEIAQADREEARVKFFSRGQPCFRASSLVKSNGWGVHHDAEGRVAIFGCETAQYQALIADERVKNILGMRSKRA